MTVCMKQMNCSKHTNPSNRIESTKDPEINCDHKKFVITLCKKMLTASGKSFKMMTFELHLETRFKFKLDKDEMMLFRLHFPNYVLLKKVI